MINIQAINLHDSNYKSDTIQSLDKINLHEKLCNKLHDTYIKKNSDYGDSFGKSFEKYGITSAMVRMEDKWNRMENLVIKGAAPLVGDESLKDTILDLANYAIMTYMELMVREENTIEAIPINETVESYEDGSLG